MPGPPTTRKDSAKDRSASPEAELRLIDTAPRGAGTVVSPLLSCSMLSSVTCVSRTTSALKSSSVARATPLTMSDSCSCSNPASP